MLEYDDPELRSWLATLDADPRVDWVDAQRDRLATAWESRTIPESQPAAFEFDSEPLVSRSTRSRRDRRFVIAAAAVVLVIVVLVVVVSRLGVDHGGVEAPRRPLPATVPDLSKTLAIVVTSRTGLRDRQIVRVSGGFVPSILPGEHIGWQEIDLQICRAGVTPLTADFDCDQTTSQDARGQQLSSGPFRRYPSWSAAPSPSAATPPTRDASTVAQLPAVSSTRAEVRADPGVRSATAASGGASRRSRSTALLRPCPDRASRSRPPVHSATAPRSPSAVGTSDPSASPRSPCA